MKLWKRKVYWILFGIDPTVLLTMLGMLAVVDGGRAWGVRGVRTARRAF
jgi:hypothetical protein